MTFEEILPFLKRGKRCYRKEFPFASYFIEHEVLYLITNSGAEIVMTDIEAEEILASDWDVVPEGGLL